MCVWLICFFAFGYGCLKPAEPVFLFEAIRAKPQFRLGSSFIGEAPWTPRQRVVHQARESLASNNLRVGGLEFEPDPVGYVQAAFWSIHVDLMVGDQNKTFGLQGLHKSMQHQGLLHQAQPEPGDLVFLRNQITDDTTPQPSMVALVESIDSHQTLTLLGHFAKGPGRIRMNFSPTAKERNDHLGPAQGTQANKLFVAYAAPY
jgi:hypothetical protein